MDELTIVSENFEVLNGKDICIIQLSDGCEYWYYTDAIYDAGTAEDGV